MAAFDDTWECPSAEELVDSSIKAILSASKSLGKSLAEDELKMLRDFLSTGCSISVMDRPTTEEKYIEQQETIAKMTDEEYEGLFQMMKEWYASTFISESMESQPVLDDEAGSNSDSKGGSDSDNDSASSMTEAEATEQLEARLFAHAKEAGLEMNETQLKNLRNDENGKHLFHDEIEDIVYESRTGSKADLEREFADTLDFVREDGLKVFLRFLQDPANFEEEAREKEEEEVGEEEEEAKERVE
jgi:hypothetical protein